MKKKALTSLSELPQRLQHLHSMHCQRYCLTDMIMLAVNWRQVGCPKSSLRKEKKIRSQSLYSYVAFIFTGTTAIGARHQLFRLARLLVLGRIAKAEIAIDRRWSSSFHFHFTNSWSGYWTWAGVIACTLNHEDRRKVKYKKYLCKKWFFSYPCADGFRQKDGKKVAYPWK